MSQSLLPTAADEPLDMDQVRIDPAWALNVVAQVGNYAESFQWNLGPLGVQRGYNRLWSDGGLMFAPPLR